MKVIKDYDIATGEEIVGKTFHKVTFNNAALWSFFHNCNFIECNFINYSDHERLNGGVYRDCKIVNCTFDNMTVEFVFYHEFLEGQRNRSNSVTKECIQ